MITMETNKQMNRNSLVAIAASSILGAIFCSSLAVAEPSAEKGKAVYEGAGACVTCHGASGAGDGPAGASLNPKPKNLAKGEFGLDTDGDGKLGTETDIFNVITNGAQKYGGSFMMVARPDLSEEDRKSLAKYILSLNKN